MKPHIKQFLQFLEKRGEKRVPIKVKLLNPKDFKLTPEEIDVEGDLDLSGTNVTSLPDNLNVKGSLNLANTPIESLSDNLTVGGNLGLSSTKITSLPNNLNVGRHLWLEETSLAEKYTAEQIRSMIEKKGGYVKKEIII